MNTQIGKVISHYRVIEKIGEGGMGVVYKAEDTKLKRTVALKFLKPEALGSEEQKARFVTEAQAAAALDHPNICTIYEINEVEGETFISMAYIEGQSLKEKIESGPLKLKEALDIAVQVAQGLQEAHEKGIFHRDIKPANIMITPKGQAKIMDFGLAKLAEGSILTKAGTMLGTICFMSPEQARGEEVDHRTDIWSLGVVIYEMLTGQLPFKGEYEQAVFYSILNLEPEPITGLRSGIPLDFEKLVNKCLEKERSDRYQHADELIVDLRRLKRDTSKVLRRPTEELAVPETRAAPAVPAGRLRKFVGAVGRLPIYIGAAALVALLVVVGYFLWRGKEGPPVPTVPSVPRLTNPTRVTTALGVEDYPTWSPDGVRLSYQSNQSGNWDIWVSQVGGGTAVNLTADHTEVDALPSWSPDGRQIAFLSNRDGGGCFVMSALGGTPRKVAVENIRWSGSPQWSSDGKELACVVRDSTGYFVEIVSMQHATSRRFLLPGKEKEPTGRELSWSPDGRLFAYVAASDRGSPISQLWVMRADDGVGFPLTDGETRDWSPGWSRDGKILYFVSNREGSMDLWQQRMGDDNRPMGSPQQLTFGLEIRYANFSPDGRKLAYSKGRQAANLWRVPILANRPATWADAQQLTFEQTYNRNVDVSPDGKRLVFGSDRDGQFRSWWMPVEGGEMQRVTTDPIAQIMPKWSPDGRAIVFHSPRGGNRDIWVAPVYGGQVRHITSHEAFDFNPSWSPDGREIAFYSNRSGNGDIWVIPAKGGTARQVTFHPALDNVPEWSPDGKWLLFLSNRTGDYRLWKVPAVGGRPESVTEITASYGFWSKDGNKIYFRKENNIWEVPAEAGKERQLTDLAGKSGGFDGMRRSTDGQYIYFSWREDIGDIWVMDVVGNE